MSATETIPGETLYWGVIELEHGAAAGAVPRRELATLEERFVELVPAPFESVKSAYIAIDARRVLAAAATRGALASLTKGDTVAVRPAGVPPSLAGDAGVERAAAGINFLWGDLEPAPVVRARRRSTLAAVAAIVVVCGLALVGVERRIGALRSAAADQRAATGERLRELYPKAASPSAASGLLDRDLARLTRTRTGRTGAATEHDAADAVAALLAAWPRDGGEGRELRMRTESLVATAQSLSLNVALEERAGATALSDRLRTVAGWHLAQPQFTASQQSGGMLNLRLTAEQAPKEARQ